MTRFRSGFTRFELQMVIVAIAIGIVAVSSVLAAESQLLKRLHASSRTPPTARVQLQR